MGKPFSGFSIDEIEEITDLRWFADRLYINGEKADFTCFTMILKLINEETNISAVSRKQLVTLYVQLREFKIYINITFPFVDNTLLDRLIVETRNAVISELKKRRGRE